MKNKLLLLLLVCATRVSYAQVSEDKLKEVKKEVVKTERSFTVGGGVSVIGYSALDIPPEDAYGVFVSKDFGADNSGVGLSSTSKLSFDYNKHAVTYYEFNYWGPSAHLTALKSTLLSFEQTGNLDFKFGWFHFQPYLSVGLGLAKRTLMGFSDTEKFYSAGLGFNMIFSDRVVVGLKSSALLFESEDSSGLGSLTVGYRF